MLQKVWFYFDRLCLLVIGWSHFDGLPVFIHWTGGCVGGGSNPPGLDAATWCLRYAQYRGELQVPTPIILLQWCSTSTSRLMLGYFWPFSEVLTGGRYDLVDLGRQAIGTQFGAAFNIYKAAFLKGDAAACVRAQAICRCLWVMALGYV